ncbi:PAS domain-containing sensor histidine kinase [Aurantimonas sp. VKM B-3413]|uniref:hybrid sensor histidine kinase/response regulator n=1 Tax=Aurantimonas sp. VKM B-3413 TaxID=2779401 RepID=UPI001E53A2B5|nr:PAS domain-containing sensor histidine kinase [Aurantimonas sp. VKM B-3413]MCB8838207.1 PAS domain S-box protein [Aurantimonas sp. VKM B-3413]
MNRNEEPDLVEGEEERYRLLVNAITDYAIYMLDPDGYVSSWNSGAQIFKGYTAEEIMGRHFSRFFTEEDRDGGLPQRILSTAARQGRFESEGWRVRKNGERFWAHVVVDPILSPVGELLGFAKVTRDLSERLREREALEKSETQFKILVDGVSDYALYMLDPAGHVSSWNVGAERIKGYRAEEILGQHFSRFYTPEDRERGEPARSLAIATREGRFEREAWRVRKDGSRFFAHVVLDAIHDRAGDLIGFAKITRDVTARRNAELELDTAREALFQSQKLQAIGQLTGGIAHDFNNLLTAVLGNLELVLRRLPEEADVVPLLRNALTGAERGAALIQRMLAFARGQELQPQPVMIDELVDGMRDLIARSLGPDITITLDLPDELPVVRADPNHLESALLNLMVNARDAMPSGGEIVVSVRDEIVAKGHHTRLRPGRYVMMSVADKGEGMDQATLARAREPFFTTKGVGKGTGLGLSMVDGLAAQLGGRLHIDSRPGKGTRVEVWLPAATEVAPADTPREEPEDAGLVPTPASRSLTILAVDDDGLVLMNTESMLEDLGHVALTAISAKDALEILRQQPGVDLVITDHAMPQMTGCQLAGEIDGAWPHLPIILATGYAELPAGELRKLQLLNKPFGLRDLERAIGQALASRAAGPEQETLRLH